MVRPLFFYHKVMTAQGSRILKSHMETSSETLLPNPEIWLEKSKMAALCINSKLKLLVQPFSLVFVPLNQSYMCNFDLWACCYCVSSPKYHLVCRYRRVLPNSASTLIANSSDFLPARYWMAVSWDVTSFLALWSNFRAKRNAPSVVEDRQWCHPLARPCRDTCCKYCCLLVTIARTMRTQCSV